MSQGSLEINLGRIYGSESKALRHLWCLTLTSTIVTILIFKERAILIKTMFLTLLPIFLQTFHVFSSSARDSNYTWYAAVIPSVLSTLVSSILICIMLFSTVMKMQADGEAEPAAHVPTVIITTWRLMYHLGSLWQGLIYTFSLITNIVYVAI